ncbi:hypothetical protein QBC47DRAFT_66757 [Echria macrotheca]|uniref:Uncharacterized protein n=1 Tax=Echria macrotheca TaxID=438768 RepID=A0AAJ0F3D7_9PEZI|nr:hypothetical protein QBC47DRAFT_66757 [Echria macrotheca]
MIFACGPRPGRGVWIFALCDHDGEGGENLESNPRTRGLLWRLPGECRSACPQPNSEVQWKPGRRSNSALKRGGKRCAPACTLPTRTHEVCSWKRACKHPTKLWTATRGYNTHGTAGDLAQLPRLTRPPSRPSWTTFRPQPRIRRADGDRCGLTHRVLRYDKLVMPFRIPLPPILPPTSHLPRAHTLPPLLLGHSLPIETFLLSPSHPSLHHHTPCFCGPYLSYPCVAAPCAQLADSCFARTPDPRRPSFGDRLRDDGL